MHIEDASYDDITKTIKDTWKSAYGKDSTRIIFTNGCFDVMHAGHVDLLHKCRTIAGSGGMVVVGVNSDESIKRLKGNDRPINDEISRASLLMSIKYVDFVVVFEEDTPIDLIKCLKPNVIVKGSDYKGQTVVGSDLAAVMYIDLVKGYSTTSIIKKMKGES